MKFDLASELAHLIAHIERSATAKAVCLTVFGALVTYVIQRLAERRRIRSERRGSIVAAQVALTTQLNTLRILWEKHLKDFENDPRREANLRQIWFVDAEPMIEIKSLSFLVTRKKPDTVIRLHLAQRSYLSAIDSVRTRNAAFEEVAYTSNLVGLSGNVGVLETDPRKVHRLKATTDQMFVAFPSAIESCERMIDELRVVGRSEYSTWFSRRFGKDGFIRLQNPSSSAKATGSAAHK